MVAVTVLLMSSLAQNSPLISCLSRPCVFLSFLHCLFPYVRLETLALPLAVARVTLSSSLIFFLHCVKFSLLCPLCLAGSGATEEEHDGVPGRDEYSHPGCSGADRRLPAQRGGRARQLEEPRRQPLQRLLQRWSGTLRQGNADQR